MKAPPAGWVQLALSALAKPSYGRALPKRLRSGGKIPVYGSAGIVGRHDRALAKAPVIIVGRKGNAGEAHLSQVDCWPIDTTYFFSTPDSVDSKFLYFQLRAANLKALDSSTAVPSLRYSDLAGFVVRFPPLDEQRRIVEVIEEQFSRLDAAESSLRTAIAKVQRLQDSTFVCVADLSDETSYVPLGEIADVVGGVAKDAKRETQPNLVEVPYLRVANVQRGFLDLGEVSSIRVSKAKAEILRLAAGDVLFNEGGDRDKLGRGWVWEEQIAQCIHQNHVFRARLDRNAYEPKFVSLYANSVGKHWFERMGKQTTNLASLGLNALKTFPVPFISIWRQQRIVVEIERRQSVYEGVCDDLRVGLRRSQLLREAIFKEAFRGRLGLSVGQPASTLCIQPGKGDHLIAHSSGERAV